MQKGNYIVIEGSDGTGKSTQVAILREKLAEQGIASIEFHEPGGLPMTDKIREIILDGSLKRRPETNLLLFTAARSEIWQKAKQQLDRGVWVVAARNYFSTLAYQGYGEGLSLELITETTRHFTDERYMKPDVAIILTLEDETERHRRIQQRGNLRTPDTFESKDKTFQSKVSDGYISIAQDYNLPVIHANGSPQEIAEQIDALCARALDESAMVFKNR